ncbi:MAG: lipocalin-like domain-containing protein [Psychromonas sp.]
MKIGKVLSICLAISLFLAVLILFSALFFSNGEKNSDGNLIKILSDNDPQFQLASEENNIGFPQAHWPHKSYKHEWWYLTANLCNESGQRFATQWTLFRTAIDDKHWYFAHAALADEQQHFAEFREGREELGTVEVIDTPFSAVINDWTWLSSADLFPAQLNYGSPQYLLQSENVVDANLPKTHWRANLSLSANKGFYLQGDNGFSVKHLSENIASHYYSQPFIEVNGEIYWQGSWNKVFGRAWFDREWGSAMLAEDQQGWDWFSLRLNEQQALMVYRIRSQKQDFIYGNLMNSDGSSQVISSSDIVVTSAQIPNSTYPESFTLTVEKMAIKLNVKIINDQQVMRFGIEYFEGMVVFTGTHSGEGFVEMTGYQ